MRSRLLLAALVCIAALAAQASALPPGSTTYVAGGTGVVRAAGIPLVDDGVLVCEASTGSGVGGGCIAWSGAAGLDSIFVQDAGAPLVAPVQDSLKAAVTSVEDAVGQDVGSGGVVASPGIAYQVCIDNNGDSICGGILDPLCPDEQFFSHSDGGAFFNPLGPLPTSFLPGCAGGFPGWVVFLCTGAHEDDTGPHAHPATTGTLAPTTGGSGFGNFCGAGGTGIQNPTVAKAYVVV